MFLDARTASRTGVSALSIYHLQCGIIYSAAGEIFQRDTRKALSAFPHYRSPLFFFRHLGNVPFFFKELKLVE